MLMAAPGRSPAAGPPAVPVVEVHDGLQRIPSACRNVSFKPRQQRDHHVYSETLVFPEIIVWGNISLQMFTASYKVKSPRFHFPCADPTWFPSKATTQILREQSVKHISSFRSSSPVISTSASAQTFRRRRNNLLLADNKRS